MPLPDHELRDERPEPAARAAPLAASGVILVALALLGLARGHDASQEVREREAALASEATPQEPIGPPDAGPSLDQVRALLEARPMDLNRASAPELELLPRIGPTLAARIVEERRQAGPFVSVEALTRVRGVGPRTVDGLRELVTVRAPREGPAPSAGSPRSAAERGPEGQVP